MSKEAERIIISRSTTEHLHWLKMKEEGGKIVKKRADELLNNLDFIDGIPKRFLKSLLPQVSLKNDVDPEKHTNPYILYPTFDDAFLVLERNLTTGTAPYNESTKGLGSSDYRYAEVMALGYKKTKDGYVVGFFGKKEKDRYLYNHPDDGDFNPLEVGKLFTQTATEEEIIPTLALAAAIYEYNKGKPLNDQITFPSEI